jgi:hypothetical protein
MRERTGVLPFVTAGQNPPIGASDRAGFQGLVQPSPARMVCAHCRGPARRGAANRGGGSFGGRQGRFGRLFNTDGPCRRASKGRSGATLPPRSPRIAPPALPPRARRGKTGVSACPRDGHRAGETGCGRAGERPGSRRALLRRQRACPAASRAAPPGRSLCNCPPESTGEGYPGLSATSRRRHSQAPWRSERMVFR